MSTLGSRQIPLLPAPSSQPDFGKAILAASQSRAIGQGQQTTQGLVNLAAGIAARPLVEQRQESELDQAIQRATNEEIRRDNTKARLQTQELDKDYDRLRDLELFGVRQIINELPIDRRADVFKRLPIEDPKNQATLARELGQSLAQSETTSIFKQITQAVANGVDPRTIEISGMAEEAIARHSLSQLHPEANRAFQRTLLQQAEGFLRSHIWNFTTARQRQIKQQSEGSLSRLATSVVMGEPIKAEIMLRQAEDVLRLTPGGLTTEEAKNNLLANALGAAAHRALSRTDADPASMRAALERLPAGIKNNLQETFGVIDAEAGNRAARRIGAQVSSIKSQAQDFFQAENLPGLLAVEQRVADLPDSQQKIDMTVMMTSLQDRLRRQTRGRDQIVMVLSGQFEGPIEPGNLPGNFPEALDSFYKESRRRGSSRTAIVVELVGNGYQIPPAATKEIEAGMRRPGLSIGDTMRDVLAVNQVDPARAVDMTRGMDNGHIVRLLLRANSKMTTEEYQGLLALMSSDEGWRAMTEGDPEGGRSALTIGMSQNIDFVRDQVAGNLGVPEATGEAVDSFIDHYRLAYLDISTDPRFVEMDARSKDVAATRRAITATQDSFINLDIPGRGVVAVPSWAYNMGSSANPMRALQANFQGGVRQMAAAHNGELWPDLPIKMAGTVVFPLASRDSGAQNLGESLVGFVEPIGGKLRLITKEKAPAFYGNALGRLEGRIGGEPLSPQARHRRREGEAERPDLVDQATGSDRALGVHDIAIASWLDEGNPFPQADDPAWIGHLDGTARSMNYTSFGPPVPPQNEPLLGIPQ